MIEIDDKVVHFDVFRKCFACDIAKCKGICCVEGDSGAPLEKAEEEKRRQQEEEDRLKQEEELRKKEEEERIRKENSPLNKFWKNIKKFGKTIVEEE